MNSFSHVPVTVAIPAVTVSTWKGQRAFFCLKENKVDALLVI